MSPHEWWWVPENSIKLNVMNVLTEVRGPSGHSICLLAVFEHNSDFKKRIMWYKAITRLGVWDFYSPHTVAIFITREFPALPVVKLTKNTQRLHPWCPFSILESIRSFM